MPVPGGSAQIGLIPSTNWPYFVILHHFVVVLVLTPVKPHVCLFRPVLVDCTRLPGRLDCLVHLVGAG